MYANQADVPSKYNKPKNDDKFQTLQIPRKFGPTFSNDCSQGLTIRIGLFELWSIKNMVHRLEVRNNDDARLEI
jgi:hypothetical protein